MKRTMFVASLLALGVTAAIAQSNKVEQRQALMKEMGAQSRTLGNMMRGQAPFDAAAVQAGLKVFAENADKAAPLFSDDTKGAEKTGALPAVWETKGNFDAIMAKLGQDARTAMTTIKDDASLKAELPKVLQNCGTCHQTYRKS
jgi:cytochrome c556